MLVRIVTNHISLQGRREKQPHQGYFVTKEELLTLMVLKYCLRICLFCWKRDCDSSQFPEILGTMRHAYVQNIDFGFA